jgi:hypothetical protein
VNHASVAASTQLGTVELAGKGKEFFGGHEFMIEASNNLGTAKIAASTKLCGRQNFDLPVLRQKH